MSCINIMICDDHTLIREGIKKIIDLEEDISVVCLAANGKEALSQLENNRIDVMLLDINMPIMNGIDTLKTIKNDPNRNEKVIILTIHDDIEYLFETINIGAEGYMLKDSDVSSLVQAIRDVHSGSTYIHPSLSKLLVKEYKKKDESIDEMMNSKLTKREYEVINLIARGCNNKDIAKELFISEKTVKNHVSNIFKKIDVSDRTQAALYAIKHNIAKL